MDKELNKYLRKIRRMIPCGLCDRRRIMDSIENGIYNYREQNPDASFSQIRAHFGTPEHIVADYLGEQTTEQVLKALQIRKRIITIVLGVVAFILLSWILYVAICAILFALSEGGYNVIEIY